MPNRKPSAPRGRSRRVAWGLVALGLVAASCTSEDDPAPHSEIEMTRRAIHVRVVGPDGAPVPFFPVTSVPLSEGRPLWEDEPGDRWTTHADGSITISADEYATLDDDAVDVVRLAPHVRGGIRAPAVEVPWGPPGVVTATLHAPATGILAIGTRDEDGMSFCDAREIRLLDGDEDGEGPDFVDASDQAARFHVPLGQRWSAHGDFRAGCGAGDIQGPTEPGQVVTFSLGPAPSVARLVGTLQTPDGQPLGDVGFCIGMNRAWTLPDGRFSLALQPHEFGRISGSDLELVVAESTEHASPDPGAHPDSSPTLRAVRVAIPELAAGRIDLGVLTPRPVPRLAAGTIRGSLRSPRPRIVVEHRATPDAEWRVLLGAIEATIEGDRFEIFGAARPGDYRASVIDSLGFLPTPRGPATTFVAGQSDLVLHAAPVGDLFVSVLAKSAREAQALEIRLVDPRSGASLAPASHGTPGQTTSALGTFVTLPGAPGGAPMAMALWTNLAPGAYRLEIRVEGKEMPILVREDVEVRAATDANTSPSVVTLDLDAATGPGEPK